MIKIYLTTDWWKKIDPNIFNQWITDNNIDETEWDFYNKDRFESPIMCFIHEKDAIAFKLRFGI